MGFWLLVLAVIVAWATGAWCGWKLRELAGEVCDDLARQSLPPDIRADIDAYRTAERMAWQTARAIERVRRLR